MQKFNLKVIARKPGILHGDFVPAGTPSILPLGEHDGYSVSSWMIDLYHGSGYAQWARERYGDKMRELKVAVANAVREKVSATTTHARSAKGYAGIVIRSHERSKTIEEMVLPVKCVAARKPLAEHPKSSVSRWLDVLPEVLKDEDLPDHLKVLKSSLGRKRLGREWLERDDDSIPKSSYHSRVRARAVYHYLGGELRKAQTRLPMNKKPNPTREAELMASCCKIWWDEDAMSHRFRSPSLEREGWETFYPKFELHRVDNDARGGVSIARYGHPYVGIPCGSRSLGNLALDGLLCALARAFPGNDSSDD